MTPRIYHIVIPTVLLMLCACGKKRMGIAAYGEYLENGANGLSIERTRNEIQTVFALYPIEWQSFKTGYAQAGMDESAYESLLKENEGWAFFSFRVFLPHKMTLDEYLAQKYENAEEALLYAEYNLKDDFTLIAAKDSIPCTAVHRQPAMGLKPYEEFLLLFRTGNPHIEDMPLRVHHNDQLLGLDTLTYAFSEQTMNGIPILQIK